MLLTIPLHQSLYAPGGSNDINARELAALMSPILGQQVIVDNKAGANGSLGLRVVAGAKPDSYTLSYTSAQTIVVNPWVQKGMIDTLTTLLPICQTTDYQYVLVANPKARAWASTPTPPSCAAIFMRRGE